MRLENRRPAELFRGAFLRSCLDSPRNIASDLSKKLEFSVGFGSLFRVFCQENADEEDLVAASCASASHGVGWL
jgi:hypothetical protein